MKGMHILWLTHRDPLHPKAGGVGRSIHELGKQFVKAGHHVTVYSAGWSTCKSRENIDGIEIIREPGNISLHLLTPIMRLHHHFDIIINDLGHGVPWLSAFFAGKRNVAYFRHLHARALPGQVNTLLTLAITFLEKIYPFIYRNRLIITESNSSFEDLIRLGIRPSIIRIIPPGIDRELFKPKPKTVTPTVVYFGGLRKYKRPAECMYAFKELFDRCGDLRMSVVGTGPEEERVKGLASDLGVLQHIDFRGKLPDADLAELVASSWINFHTSKTEGWGYSILESSAAGTPTVAYDVPGVRDVIVDRVNGLKVKDGDRNAFIEAAYGIISKPDNYWKESHRYANKYSWGATAEAWENVFLEITSNSLKDRLHKQ